MERRFRDPNAWIGVRSGTKVWPLEPRVEEINIEDIAVSLARQTRFKGHCERFYSVAEHSVWVSYQVSPPLALKGLLHDAAEAYFGDMVRPLKGRCYFELEPGCYRPFEVCELIMIAKIFERFGLTGDMPREISLADDRMLATERLQLFDETQPEWECLRDVLPFPIKLNCHEPEMARRLFLGRFEELRTDR